MKENRGPRKGNRGARTQLGLDENIEAALSYLLGFITGIILYLLEPENRFIRFHALQSTILFGAIFILDRIIAITITISMSLPRRLIIIQLLGLISTLILIATIILWIILIYQAYQGKKYKLPYIGEIAEKHK
ncbi:MAG: Tic20 family membrane protein implicated in protein translocation [Candidatus Methanohalarchaeum thermophilum]|uniref:Tic20 family membrane protein implicated in protein translocation n=1 Tax=Methanohalarchaeum thermophilum TaxID=1903181 RepID=A0A1Q6DT60_METT1|nr:MAG: Tic20 family membrane protein implicated in protein translocation [Candidatus Methanohalarchaeum thermophilum]